MPRQADRCPRRDGRTGGVRHRQAGGCQHCRPDRGLLGRPAIRRGRMEASDALSRLARSSGLEVKKVGANSYVLVASARPRPATRAKAAAKLVRLAAQPLPEPEPNRKTSSSPPASAIHCPSAFRANGRGSTEANSRRSAFPVPRRSRVALGRLFLDSFGRRPQQAVHPRHRRSQFQRPDPVAGRPIFRRHAHRLQRARSRPEAGRHAVGRNPRGPAGTLYGSGALGGIVLLKPNMPDLGEFSGTAAIGG